MGKDKKGKNSNDSILKTIFLVSILGGASLTPCVCFSGEEEIPSKWHLEAGPIYRAKMNAEVTGSSRSRDAVFEAAQPSSSIPSLAQGHAKEIPNPDDITAIGNRNFDDGYVHTDAITPIDSRTVNFGYINDSQFDPSTSTLTFNRMTEVRDSQLLEKGIEFRKSVSTTEDPIDAENDFTGAGVKVNTLYDLPPFRDINLAVFAGLRGYFGMDNTVEVSNFSRTITESRTPYRDTYFSTDTILDKYIFSTYSQIPAAPYDNPNGNPNGDPLISNIPRSVTRNTIHSGIIRRDVGASQTTSWETKNHIAVDMDIDMFQLAVGGELSYEVDPHVAISMRPSVLINLLDIEMTRSEELTAFYPNGDTKPLANWQDQQSDEIVRLGAALEAGMDIKITESWFAGISAGYEWIDETSMEIGPNTVALDLSGFSTSATIGVRF